jgi:hypothetical protein
MIDAQFRLNQCNSFREEHISVSLQVLPWNLRQLISYFFTLTIYSINL